MSRDCVRLGRMIGSDKQKAVVAPEIEEASGGLEALAYGVSVYYYEVGPVFYGPVLVDFLLFADKGGDEDSSASDGLLV